MRTTFNDDNSSIFKARVATQEYIEHEAKQGNLSNIAKDERRVAVWLASGTLFEYIRLGHIKLAMIERWVSEAVAAQSQPVLHTVLNGEVVYRRWREVRGDIDLDWHDPALPDVVREAYEALAAVLMDDLGLCYICGQHPDAHDKLEEVNKIKVCPDCSPWLKTMSEGQEE
jgi:sugar (pentulose or hexulose) kinase